ncbi:MAG: carbohydrate-binding family 9-like protein [Oscillospiraceae bacterium]|nr:carbohydrate-binding family 9-like protein [Oscillospiraceae bacterium]
MKTYTITRVSGTPDWSAIPELEFTETYRHTLEETPVRAWTQLAYSDEALFVRQRATEPNIRRELTGLLDEICEDSCLEYFVSPMEGDLRYFNIEYNFNCCRYLGFGSNRYDLVRLVPEEGDCFEPVTAETADGWEITYKIPYHFIRRFFPDFDPAPGKAMRANFSKCGGKTVRPHWLTWNRLPFADNKLDFHSPEHYGRLVFG